MTETMTDEAERSRLYGEAQVLRERYREQRDTVERTRAAEIVPKIIALSKLWPPPTQAEIGDLLGIHRLTVADVQRQAGLTRPRHKRAGDGS